MQESGDGGAWQVSKEIEHLYGFHPTAPEFDGEQVWRQAYDVYIADRHKLGINRFFAEQNPHAGQMLAARLLELVRHGVYRCSAEERKQLLAASVQSVVRHGVSCYANACDNRRLTAHIRREALAAGVSSQAFRAWQ
ncbi:MAG: cobaltochelatase subunit CobN [Acidobacteria bacterium]|nr:cobaltochelatase subunit CobN [Acidobacteriota bacterium]